MRPTVLAGLAAAMLASGCSSDDPRSCAPTRRTSITHFDDTACAYLANGGSGGASGAAGSGGPSTT